MQHRSNALANVVSKLDRLTSVQEMFLSAKRLQMRPMKMVIFTLKTSIMWVMFGFKKLFFI